MRRGTRTAFGLALAGPAIALLLAGCGGPEGAAATDGTASAALDGDAALIAAAQTISDAVGGCVRPDDAPVDSKVVGLENGAIVMLGCSVGANSTTHRLFAIRTGEKPELLSFPDYDTEGWFASDQVSMAEIDAGTGVLSTFRKSAGHGGCGSEGEYEWDGARFALRELRWNDCAAAAAPPFPVVWPTQQGASTDADTATPAP